jgi:RNA polymerase-interacting CarD/CdnL/TRCF family regulator
MNGDNSARAKFYDVFYVLSLSYYGIIFDKQNQPLGKVTKVSVSSLVKTGFRPVVVKKQVENAYCLLRSSED